MFIVNLTENIIDQIFGLPLIGSRRYCKGKTVDDMPQGFPCVGSDGFLLLPQ